MSIKPRFIVIVAALAVVSYLLYTKFNGKPVEAHGQYINFNATIVAFNTESFYSQNDKISVSCNTTAFKVVNEERYFKISPCVDNGVSSRFTDSWAMKHSVGDTIHFDSLSVKMFTPTLH